MTKESRADRIKWLTELREAIPKFSDQVTKRTIEIWSLRLLRISMPTLVMAANILAERNASFPSLAEILVICREVDNRASNRRWKYNLEAWEQESLSPGEAKKLLTAVLDAASGNEAAIIPFRGSGLKRILTKEASSEKGET